MSKAKWIIDRIFNQLRTWITFIAILYKFNIRVCFFLPSPFWEVQSKLQAEGSWN